ncbi:MAG: ComEA family DNA-binding protein [Desulfosalsimonas sp.]
MSVYRKVSFVFLVLFLAVTLSGVFLPAGAADADDRININTAEEEQLTELKGIGPVTAARIIDFRDDNGSFSDAEDLLEVKGIGPETVADIQDRISFEQASD